MKRKKRELSDAELREYYDRTSEFGEGKPYRPVKMTFPKPKPRTLVALRLDQETLLLIKRLAASKGLNFSTLIRLWVTERLRKEARSR